MPRPTLGDLDRPWPERIATTSSQRSETLRERSREMRAAMSPPELVLWQHLRRNQLLGLKFRRQHVLGLYIADFYCHELRLVVEVDGAGHAQTGADDRHRDEFMIRHGLRVVRLPAVMVLKEIGAAVGEIERVARELMLATSRDEKAVKENKVRKEVR